MKLKDKVAVVTGGASGFGKEICQTFAREGAKVVVADINGQGAREVAQNIGAAATHIACDVADKSDVDAMIAEAVRKFGGLDITVNNAGYTHPNQSMLDVDEATFDRIFAVNVKAIYLAVLASVPEMEKRGRGRDYQHSLNGRRAPAPRSDLVQRLKGRCHHVDEIYGSRTGAQEDPCLRHQSGDR